MAITSISGPATGTKVAERPNPPSGPIGPSSAWSIILDGAKKNLGIALADADRAQAQADARYQQMLNQSAQGRAKGTKSTRESDAGRGMLQSSSALDNQVEVNQAYDNVNSSALGDYNGWLQQVAAQRLNANNNYTNSLMEYEKAQTQQITPELLATLGLGQPTTAPGPIGPATPTNTAIKASVAAKVPTAQNTQTPIIGQPKKTAPAAPPAVRTGKNMKAY